MRKKYQKWCRLMAMVFFVLCSSLFLLSGCGKADSEYSKGVDLAKEGKYQKASHHLEKAISENKDQAQYYISYGMILNHMGKYQKANSIFDKALQVNKSDISDKNNKQLLFGKAVSFYGLREYSQTVSYCKKSMAIKELSDLDIGIQKTQAAALQLLGKQEEALALYNKIIKNNEDNTDAYLRRADLKIEMKNTDGAKEDYQKIIKIDSSAYDAYFGLFNLYQSQGLKSQADSIIQTVISKKASDASDICQIGRAYYYLKEYDKALDYLGRSITKGNAEAYYYRGLVKMTQKGYDNAIRDFEKYIQEKGSLSSAKVYNQLAGCEIAKFQYAQAEKYIKLGLAMNDRAMERDLWTNQVILLEKSGQFAQANVEAKKYLTVYADDAGMKKELAFIQTRI